MAKKIVLDPGHGGTDPGASGNGIIEKDMVLDITNYMYKRIKDLGLEVSTTRETDITLDPTDRTNKVQSFYGNGNDVIVISNHINAGGGDGAEVIYALRNDDILSQKILEELLLSGQNIRKYYQRRLSSDSSQDYYYMHRNTPNNETVIVEYGFLDSTGDDPSQLLTNWQQYSEAVTKAVVEYAGGVYKPLDGTDYHIVVSGDTLYSLANKYGVTASELKSYNNLTSDSLSLNQIIYIPSVTVPDSSTDLYYTVKSGDTLYKISVNYGVSVDEIKKLNNLTKDTLSIGQVLKLSESIGDNNEYENNTYIVKSGDTLYSIAAANDITVTELRNLNNLTSDILSLGQVLIISKENIFDNDTPSNNEYIVQSGDSLYSIAKKFNTSAAEIQQLNNLASTLLSIGQVLLIPTGDEDNDTIAYTVKSGDTLYSIASLYNTTVSEIKRLNNLTSDSLSLNQVILLPGSQVDGSLNAYTVKSGDTLYSIANLFGASVNDIKEKNNLISTTLSIGQVILIP